MTTGQNYVGKESHATSVEQTVNTGSQTAQQEFLTPEKSLTFGNPATTAGKHTITVLSAFGGILRDPQQINLIRQDLRSWFMAYVPTWENSYSECTLTESINNYELLDHFLSSLIHEGVGLMEEGGKTDE